MGYNWRQPVHRKTKRSSQKLDLFVLSGPLPDYSLRSVVGAACAYFKKKILDRRIDGLIFSRVDRVGLNHKGVWLL